MPLTQNDLEAVKALAKAGRIEEARSLLAGIDDDRARGALAKFNEKYPLPAPKAETPKPNPSYTMWGILAICVLTALVAMIGVPLIGGYINRLPRELWGVCYDQLVEQYPGDRETRDKLSEGCDLAVKRVMDTQSEALQLCADIAEDLLSTCLKAKGIRLNPEYELEQAK